MVEGDAQPDIQLVRPNRDKAASMGLSMQQIGSDLSSMVGGNFVNRFNIDGRSYKVIPQIARSERLTTEQLSQIHITGPDGKLMPTHQNQPPPDLRYFKQTP